MKTIKNLKAEEIRKSILQLAIQGKLVKQDPNDEPASELVKRIYAEKQKLIKEGKIKKNKNESYIFKGDDNCYYEKIGNNEPVKLEDLPFDISDNWMWIRQKNICWLDNGTKTKGEKLPYLEAKVIRRKSNPIYFEEGVVIDSSIRVILVDGENSGEIMTPPFKGYMGSTFKIFSAVSSFNYNYLLLIFALNKNKYKNSKVGAAIPHLNKELFKESYIAVPPINEQQRIVQKINSFEPLISKYDELEKKQTTLEKEFPEKLKKSILQYAIEGKLVKQDPNDEPASVLLERIKKEKEKLIKEGKIKRDKNESYIYQGDDKNYYENLPNGWIITTYRAVLNNVFGGGTPSKLNPSFWNGDISWCSVKDLGDELFINKTIDSITSEGLENSSAQIVEKDDLILCTRMAVGKLRIAGKAMAINQDLKGLVTSININKSFFIKQVSATNFIGTGTTVKGLQIHNFLSHQFLLPPLKEQNRIAKKIDDLFDLLI